MVVLTGIEGVALQLTNTGINNKEGSNETQLLLDLALEDFKSVLKYRESYKFTPNNEDDATIKACYSDIPYFRKGSFSDFIKWFNKFEVLAEWYKLNAKRIFIIIEKKVKPLKMNLNKLIPEGTRITNTRELQILLISHIYNKEEAVLAMNRLETYNSQSKDIHKITRKFLDLCHEVVIAMVTFKVPMFLKPGKLASVFINNLPQELKILCELNFLYKKSVPIIEIIEYAEKLAKEIGYTLLKEPMIAAMEKSFNEVDHNKKLVNMKCKYCGKKGHLKKNCKHRDEKCDKSKKLGQQQKICIFQPLKGKNDKTLDFAGVNQNDWIVHLHQFNTKLEKLEKLTQIIVKKFKKLIKQQVEYGEKRQKKKKPKVRESKDPNKKLKIKRGYEKEDHGFENNFKEEVIEKEEETDDEETENYQINPFSSWNTTKTSRIYQVFLNGQLVNCKFFSGADCTFMSSALFKKLNLKKEQSLKKVVLHAGTSTINAFKTEDVTIAHPLSKVAVKTKCCVVQNEKEFLFISNLLTEQLKIQYAIKSGPSTYQLLFADEGKNDTTIMMKETIFSIMEKS